MGTDNKKRIDAKQFVRDVEAGMHPTALMAAYGLSPSELQKAFKKLEERGLLKPPKPAKPPVSRKQSTFECPSCGAVHAEPFDECPNCGVVLSKIREQGPAWGRAPMREEPRDAALREHQPAVPPVAKTGIFKIAGIAAIVVVLLVAFLVYREMKRAEILALTKNVQAVLDASNAPTPPNYSRLARMFGAATGSMAAVLESRRTPYNEKMHELYQKMVYLGELQKRTEWKGGGNVTNIGAYRHAMDAARSQKKVVARELDGLGQSLDAGRSALADAPAGPETEQEVPTAVPGVIPGSPADPVPDKGSDSTAAQFEQAQEDLRSLCAQVLQMLAAR